MGMTLLRGRSTAFVTLFMYLSPVIGLVLDLLLVRVIGIGSVLDVFRLLLSTVILGSTQISSGTFRYVLIPELGRFRARGSDRAGLRYAAKVTLVTILAIAPAVVLIVVYPSAFLHILGPGLSDDVRAGTSPLVRMAALGVVFAVAYGAAGAVLQFHDRPLGPTISQTVQNGSMIVVITIGAHWTLSATDAQVATLAASLAAGFLATALAFGVMWVRSPIRRLGADQQAVSAGEATEALPIAALLVQLVIITSEVVKAVNLNRSLSDLAPGSIAVFSYAFRLLQLGFIPALALSSTLFPAAAIAAATRSPAETRRAFFAGARTAIVASAIVTVLMVGLARPTVQLVFAFSTLSPADSDRIVTTYQILATGTLGGVVCLFLTEFAYSHGMRASVAVVSIFTVALSFLLYPVSASYGLAGPAGTWVGISYIYAVTLGAWLAFRVSSLSKRDGRRSEAGSRRTPD